MGEAFSFFFSALYSYDSGTFIQTEFPNRIE